MSGADLGELLGTVDRLADDVERLRVNVRALIGEPRGGAPTHPSAGERTVVEVSDTPYDSGLWHGADDEGVGGHRPQASPFPGHAGF